MIKSVLPLSSIIALRFLGLFLVLPVISVYALELKGATTFLVGIVIGGYALTQMLFQIPFGVMSDKLGRKGTIITGLLIFAVGSIICAVSVDIISLILGRLLQGAGAIGAVVSATISDVVKEESRAKAMAIMGSTIAFSFAISMLAGPTIASFFGTASLFWITAIFALISIFIVVKLVPNPPKITHAYNDKLNFMKILSDSNLIKMNITNFLQKGLMTFAFMIIPITLTKSFGWDFSELYKVYAPAMVFGVLAMGPAAVIAEKKGKFREILIIGIILFGISYLIIGNSTTNIYFIIGVVLFFIGFNMHEPIMQSLASKFAKVHERGAVLGIFNSFGYLGTFFGGLLGGAFLDKLSLSTLALIVAIICVLWAILIFVMPNPSKKRIAYFKLSEINKNNLNNLSSNEHVDEWYINESEALLIIKYHADKIEELALANIIK